MGYVFGPVPSRRLGRSLGVDLVPFKTCTYDCIYCQLGRTTHQTVERRAWVPVQAVLREVRACLNARPDYITLAGSGEPTLHVGLDVIIAGLKGLTDIPVAVLTNGSLLWLPEVRAALAQADVVLPTLAAGDEALFRYVHRPHETVTFERLVEGLIAFREAYDGKYWLEVFLLGGVTAIPAEVEKIAAAVRRIRPDRVQVNTVTRPPSEPYAMGVEKVELERLAQALGDHAEVIADYHGPAFVRQSPGHCEAVLGLLRRRPCSLADVAIGLGMHPNEAVKCLGELAAQGLVEVMCQAGVPYYRTALVSDEPAAY